MNKETLSKDINFIAPLAVRTIGIQNEFTFKKGDMIINKKSESWQCNSDSNFNIENPNYKIEVVFYCKNLPCHKVDYDNEEEVEILNAVKGEGEVLVPAGTHFKILDVGTIDDIKDVGYISIDLEYVKERRIKISYSITAEGY